MRASVIAIVDFVQLASLAVVAHTTVPLANWSYVERERVRVIVRKAFFPITRPKLYVLLLGSW